jgi:hypothetical protein
MGSVERSSGKQREFALDLVEQRIGGVGRVLGRDLRLHRQILTAGHRRHAAPISNFGLPQAFA